MLTSPWDLVLTIAFVFTGVVCVGSFAARHRSAARGPDLSDEDVVDLSHGIMSAAMILMIWVVTSGVVTWAQIGVFAVLAVGLLLGYRSARAGAHRTDLAVHVLLNVAMIWMLAAMPLLMAGMTPGGSSGHGAHAEHGGGGSGMAIPTSTPSWVEVVNFAFVALCAAGALWWVYRLVTAHGHRLHTVCHVVMAAGMGTMLVLMGA